MGNGQSMVSNRLAEITDSSSAHFSRALVSPNVCLNLAYMYFVEANTSAYSRSMLMMLSARPTALLFTMKCSKSFKRSLIFSTLDLFIGYLVCELCATERLALSRWIKSATSKMYSNASVWTSAYLKKLQLLLVSVWSRLLALDITLVPRLLL